MVIWFPKESFPELATLSHEWALWRRGFAYGPAFMSAPDARREPELSSPPRTRGGWVYSPVVHFLVVAGLLTGAHAVYSRYARTEIAVTEDWLQVLERDFELQMGRPSTERERQVLVADHVRNEILCHEALKAGHLEDPRVRRVLANTMREKLEPAIAEPPDQELAEFRGRDPGSWRSPMAVSFDHVSFSKNDPIPDDMLARLRAGEMLEGTADRRMARPLPVTWLPQIAKMMGDGFAEALKGLPEGEWVGPVESSEGLHFIKVLQREPEQDMPFASIRAALAAKWTEGKREAAVMAGVDARRAGYRVTVPEGYQAR